MSEVEMEATAYPSGLSQKRLAEGTITEPQLFRVSIDILRKDEP